MPRLQFCFLEDKEQVTKAWTASDRTALITLYKERTKASVHRMDKREIASLQVCHAHREEPGKLFVEIQEALGQKSLGEQSQQNLTVKQERLLAIIADLGCAGNVGQGSPLTEEIIVQMKRTCYEMFGSRLNRWNSLKKDIEHKSEDSSYHSRFDVLVRDEDMGILEQDGDLDDFNNHLNELGDPRFKDCKQKGRGREAALEQYALDARLQGVKDAVENISGVVQVWKLRCVPRKFN
ncbi:hypothetical protein EON64_05295 [archaeon]|nr:MAG: hypothetical protein EON64_05295 [archaeon]